MATKIIKLTIGDTVQCENVMYYAGGNGIQIPIMDQPLEETKLYAVGHKNVIKLSGNEFISYQGKNYVFVPVSPTGFGKNQHQLVCVDILEKLYRTAKQ